VAYDVFSKYLPHMQAGKVRILLTTKRDRVPRNSHSDELGYKQSCLCLAGRLWSIGLPEDVKNVLVSAVEKAAKNPR